MKALLRTVHARLCAESPRYAAQARVEAWQTVDGETLEYVRLSGRPTRAQVDWVMQHLAGVDGEVR